MNALKQTSAITVLAAVAALVTATSVSAAGHQSVLEKISRTDEAPVSYTLAGKSQAVSGFRNGILPSAVGQKEQAPEKAVEYKVRYQTTVATVPARSQFRNDILSSAKGKAPEETAQIARFHLMDE